MDNLPDAIPVGKKLLGVSIDNEDGTFTHQCNICVITKASDMIGWLDVHFMEEHNFRKYEHVDAILDTEVLDEDE